MSAFVVDKAHINAIVRSGLAVRYKPLRWYHDKEWRELTSDNASAVGQMLLEECIKSVCHRYEDSDITDLPGRNDAEYIIPFGFRMSYNPPTPVETLKIIDCYSYQSCEHPDWEESEAYQFCESLRSSTIDRLPGYDDAPWEWTSWPEENLSRII